jgi:sigma-B regulation protein RsbU (phosphoserine phosphatase)
MTTRTLTYANAGHSPVIYRPRGGAPRLLKADGAPIGLLTTNSWRNQQLVLAPGDLLLIGTDGLVEQKNATRTMFGYERLLTVVDELGDCSAKMAADQLFEALHSFADAPRDDDQALMVIRGV